MNKDRFKNIVFSTLNVLVIAGIIVFIIAGLWRIGLVEMPAFLGNIFASPADKITDNSQSTEHFLEENRLAGDYEIIKLNMDTESVREILNNLVPAKEYSHDFQYKLISGKKTTTKRFAVISTNDVSCAYFVSYDGAIVNKQIIETADKTIVNTVAGPSLRTEEYVSGNISFEEQIGAVLTHKDFLALADEPDFSFSLASSDNGMLLVVYFSSVMEDYTQQQTYILNLDYGIVTEAQCYENDRLIYELTTNSISENTDTSLTVPHQFTDYLDNLVLDVRTEEEQQEAQG